MRANPLHIGISRGNADINVVLADVLALTKLNYNACMRELTNIM